MRLLALFLVFLFATLDLRAADNEIFLHNGQIRLGPPSDWVILAHSPVGKRTVIAFQIFGNEAEAGTQAATNLTVATFDLSDAEAAQAFAAPLTRRTQTGVTSRDYEQWSIREWEGEQDGKKYAIRDARMTLKKLNIGVHVRLAWPLLPNNPADYTDKMDFLFKTTIDSIARKNPDAA